MTQALKITLGARYNYDKKAIEGINNADAILAFGVPGFKQTVHFTRLRRGPLSLTRPTSATSTQAITKASRAAVWSRSGILRHSGEAGKNLERGIGAKLNFVDGRVKLNLAAFHYKSTDLQVQTVVFPTGSITTNAGAAKGDGVNVELQLAPAKRASAWVAAWATFMRAIPTISTRLYELTPGGTGFSIIPIVPGSNAPDLTGFPLESAPNGLAS